MSKFNFSKYCAPKGKLEHRFLLRLGDIVWTANNDGWSLYELKAAVERLAEEAFAWTTNKRGKCEMVCQQQEGRLAIHRQDEPERMWIFIEVKQEGV